MSFLASLAALAASLQGAVAPPPALSPAAATRETILVTAIASRVEQAVDATPATVRVIGREELERNLARDVRDALRYEPGISVENAPARFGLGNIAIRGLEGNRVQMLVDGVRLPEGFRIGSLSNASRNPFDLGLLSRIEVLRGPASALYGSDALAGVVSLTTLDPADLAPSAARPGGLVDAAYARADRSLRRTAAAALGGGPVEILAGATRTEGEERENRGELDVVGVARTTPNPQEGRGDSRLAKVVLPIAGGGRLRATWDRFERAVRSDVLSLNPQSSRTVSLAGDDRAERTRASVDGLHYGIGPVDRLSWLVYVQRSETRQDTAEVRANTTAACLSAAGNVRCLREARFTFEQQETGLTLLAESRTGDRHQLVYGAEWSRTRAEEMRDGRQTNLGTGAVTHVVGTDAFPTRDFPNSTVERSAAFVQDEIALGRITLIPALRYDRFRMTPRVDSVYAAGNAGRAPVAITDQSWSPKLGVLLALAPHATLTLQAATGFRAPPYFDANIGVSSLPLGYAVIPNADLEPEKSRGLELGIRGRRERLDYAVTAFRTDYSDLIVSRAPLPCPGDPRCAPNAPITFQSQNVTRARIEGIEARAEAGLATGWRARLGAAWARGDDRTRRVPLNSVDPAKLVAGLSWETARAGAQLHVTHVVRKDRIDTSAGALFATPAHTTADLTAYVHAGRGVTLHAGAWNLFDRKHWLWSDVRGALNPGATVDRYTQPGRAFGVQVRARF